MKRALITTTINVPVILHQWAAQLSPDDHIIIAGDQHSPHDGIAQLCNDLRNSYGVEVNYLEPMQQRGWWTSQAVGWSCIQRRNIALLEALKTDADYIITVDDDNDPDTGWVEQVDRILDGEAHSQQLTTSSSGWYDIGQALLPSVTHRGYPIDRRHEPYFVTGRTDHAVIGVFASLWTGDPDIDAVERIVNAPDVERCVNDVILDLGTWCPFNSQATAYRRELAPIMYMWPGVGRYDDIWSSYVARVVMDVLNWHVRYGRPLVHQDRNEHDLVRDLEAEIFGMRHTPELVDLLRRSAEQLAGTSESPVILQRKIHAEILTLPWLPTQTIKGFAAWDRDLIELGVK